MDIKPYIAAITTMVMFDYGLQIKEHAKKDKMFKILILFSLVSIYSKDPYVVLYTVPLHLVLQQLVMF